MWHYSYDTQGNVLAKAETPFPEGTRQAASEADYDLENYTVVIGLVREGRIAAASRRPKPVAELIQNIQQRDAAIAALRERLNGIETAIQEGLT